MRGCYDGIRSKLTRDGFSTSWIGDTNESLEEGRVLTMVPVAEDDGELIVVRVYFGWRVEEKRCAETVDVLSLYFISVIAETRPGWITYGCVGVNPVGAPLTRRVEWYYIIELATWRNATGVTTGQSISDDNNVFSHRPIPFRDSDGSVHPRGRIEEHPVMMEGGRLVEAIGGVNDEGIGSGDVHRRWSARLLVK